MCSYFVVTLTVDISPKIVWTKFVLFSSGLLNFQMGSRKFYVLRLGFVTLSSIYICETHYEDRMEKDIMK